MKRIPPSHFSNGKRECNTTLSVSAYAPRLCLLAYIHESNFGAPCNEYRMN